MSAVVMNAKVNWALRILGVILLTCIALWGNLAQISPDTFQVKGDTLRAYWTTAVGTTAAFGPTIAILLLACGFIWVLARLERIERVGTAPSKHNDGLLVVAAGRDVTTVRFNQRDVELESAAHDFFKAQSPEGQERLLRLMRRTKLFNTPRWTKEDFLMEVDERQRVSIRLGRYVASGDAIKRDIEAEILDRLTRPTGLGLGRLFDERTPTLAGAIATTSFPDFKLQSLGGNVQSWQDEVSTFLRTENPGMEPEFSRHVDFPVEETDPLKLLVHRVAILTTRLVDIKKRLEQW